MFKQYLPGKSSKYGVKISKLCDSSGYTYKAIVYEGKMKKPGLSDERVSNTVVKNLMHTYLNTGRTLVADNYYNNMKIAEDLLNQNTHLVGTLRKNVKHTPKNVMKDDKKMKKGDIIGMENDKVTFEFLFGTAVVNAWNVFKCHK